MAKLIGTGKDPRFPEGQDYDVPDFELEHHVRNGLGDPVEPGFEASAVHRGRDTIAEDQLAESDPVQGRPPNQDEVGSASRVAARVETTATPGKRPASADKAVEHARSRAETVGESSGDAGGAVDPEAEGGHEASSGGGLSKLSRDELNDRAKRAGVEDPESYRTKDDLAAAVREREGSGDAQTEAQPAGSEVPDDHTTRKGEGVQGKGEDAVGGSSEE
jgi:hypothetical protein